MGRVHRIAGLRISRIASDIDAYEITAQGRELLPDLEPAEDRLRRNRSHIFSADTLYPSHSAEMVEVFDLQRRTEKRNLTSRATVYAMNGIVMVMALPVGLALLCYNIVSGESVRTTAHAMALTGLFLALAGTDEGARLLSLVGA